MSRRAPFTLVTTVFNEAGRIEQSIADLEAQTLYPDELIIVDAGSKDGTLERLEAWSLTAPFTVRPILERGCNIAQGRNLAIGLARHEVIASTDFGCRFDPRWLESLVTPLLEDPTLEVTGGAFATLGELDTPAARADYILADGYRLSLDETFSVSSRSIAYRRHVWRQIGGYQEWLTLAADDTIFWRQIKLGGFRYRLIPEPHVYWLRHCTYRAFAREAGRYGLGDGESGINRRTFYSTLAETLARYAWLAALLLTPVLPVLTRGLVAPGVGVPRLAGMLIVIGLWPLATRSLARAIRHYRRLKREDPAAPRLGLADLLGAFWLIELTRWHYLRSYWRGWQQAPAHVQAARRRLGALPV